MKKNLALQLLNKSNRGFLKAPANFLKNEDGSLDIYVYDVIYPDGWGVSAKDIAELLAQNRGKPVNVRINTPGGDVFECRTMITALRAHDAPVTCYVDGLAASCGSWLMMAGQKTIIADGAMVMIHNSWSVAYGDKNDFKKTADLMQKIDDSIIYEYAKKSGKNGSEFVLMMDDETWLTAQEALDMGLVDEIKGAAKAGENALSNWDLSVFENAPKKDFNNCEAEQDTAIAAATATRERRLRLAQLS